MSYIFGPVPSRRLGLSLGVDVVPFKTCSFDCIYCQLGPTTRKTLQREEFVSSDAILSELAKKLKENVKADYITFSGSGEPTLNSAIGVMIRRTKELTEIPVAVLTNGSLLYRKEVREELSAADLIIPSLDAGSEESFREINRPVDGLTFNEILKGLKEFGEEYNGRIWLEVMLIKGLNDGDELYRLRSLLKGLHVDKIQLNTVIRPPAERYARALNPQEMAMAAQILGEGAEVIADFNRLPEGIAHANLEEEILQLLNRRPCTVADIAGALNIHQNEVVKYLGHLVQAKRITLSEHDKRIYWQGVKNQ